MVQFRSSNEDGTVQNVAVDGGDEVEDAQETMRRKYGRNIAVPRQQNVNDLKRVNLETKRRFKNKQVMCRTDCEKSEIFNEFSFK